MTDIPSLCESVLRLDKEATNGPWRWEFNGKAHQVQLCGENRFDLTVIDFKRWGMMGATPRFREDVDRMNIMHPAEKWAHPVEGREHHANWFKKISHPDADLIATYRTAAPILAIEILRLRAENEHLRMEDGLSKFYAQKDEIERLRAELAEERRKVEVAIRYLSHFQTCQLTSGNCASFDVANKRIRNIADNALAALTSTERGDGE